MYMCSYVDLPLPWVSRTFAFNSDLHILAINHEIPWSKYKWVDINGYGMHMPAGGYDERTGLSYEPKAHADRLLDMRVPEPGREIAIISEKWGAYGSNIKCKISLFSVYIFLCAASRHYEWPVLPAANPRSINKWWLINTRPSVSHLSIHTRIGARNSSPQHKMKHVASLGVWSSDFHMEQYL